LAAETHNDDQKVSYTVKEVLARIEGKIDGLAISVAAKADATALDKLDGRVTALEFRNETNKELAAPYLAEWTTIKTTVRRLEAAQEDRQAVTRYRRWLLASVVAGLTALAALVGVVTKFRIT